MQVGDLPPMQPRTGPRCLVSAVALILLTLGSQSPANAQPNVVLFIVDDMGWTDWEQLSGLNPTGSIVYETPNIHQLAQSGVVFDTAYAAASICSPSRAAMMTGKSPARIRITDFIAGSGNQSTLLSEPDWVKDLPPEEITLPEVLVSAGYDTGFFGKWHLGRHLTPGADPLQNGFGLNIAGHHLGNPAPSGGFFAGADGDWELMPGLDVPGTFPSDTYLPDPLADNAEQFIESHYDSGSPFFIEVALYLVHSPYEAPQPLIDYFRTKIETLEGQGADLGGHTYARYAAMVKRADDALGRVLARLDDPNDDGDSSDSIRDNTIIVFVSDNGGVLHSVTPFIPATSNGPLREGKGSLYDGGLRVPMIVSWTGNPAMPDTSGTQGRVSNERTTSYDIYPTVLDLTGVLTQPVPMNTGIDGVSIRPALENQAFDRGDLFWHYPHLSPQQLNNPDITGGSFVSAIRRDGWKLLLFWDSLTVELYDVENDPGETVELSQAKPQIASQLLNALGLYLEGVDAQLPINTQSGLELSFPWAPVPALGSLAHAGLMLSILLAGLASLRLLRRER
jgi:arylsulfatase A